MITHGLSATTPDDPAYEIRPSHWNAAHVQGYTVLGNTSGASTVTGTDIYLSAGPNATISVNGKTLVFSGGAGAAGNTGYLSAAGVTASLGTIVLSNSNGVSFGLNGQTLTATVKTDYQSSNANYLTSQSNQAFSAPGGSSAFQTLIFANSQGVSFSNSNGSVVASVKTDYLTTAALSNQVVNSFNGSTGQITVNIGSSLSSSTNGSSITFGLASNITTALQSAGAYLTTARASNDAVGLNTAQSNVTWTVNSSGISFDARGYAGTATAITGAASITLNSSRLSFNGAALAGTTSGFTGANISASITHNTAGLALSMSVAAPGGGGNFSAGVSGGNTSGDTGITGTRVVFAGGNNITLSQATDANGATITVSGANAGGAQTGISGIQVSDTTYTVGTVIWKNANGISFGSSGANGVSASYTVPAATSWTVSDNATSATVGRLAFTQSNGLTLSLSTSNNGNHTVIGSYTVPTVTNSSMTVSDAGTSGTLARLAFTNLNGVTLSLSTGAGGSHTIVGSHNALTSQSNQNVTAANGGFAFQTLSFSNANAFSFGTSAGSAITGSYTVPVVTDFFSRTNTTFNGANISGSLTLNTAGLQVSLSVAAPGAAAENNAIQLLGANTAGNTTATGSTIGWSGVNITFSGTNGSQVVASVPATSSLVGTNGVSISTNGSTITVSAVPRSEFNNFAGLGIAGAGQGNSLVSIQPFKIEWPLAFSNLVVPISIGSVNTAANNSTAYIDITLSGVIYTRNASTLSSVASFSGGHTATWSSNATASVTAGKFLTATFAGTTLNPDNYWLAVHVSSNNTATGGANTTALGNSFTMILGSNISTAQQAIAIWGNQTNATVGPYSGLGMISTGATRATIGLSLLTMSGTSALNAPVAFGLRNATYQ